MHHSKTPHDHIGAIIRVDERDLSFWHGQGDHSRKYNIQEGPFAEILIEPGCPYDGMTYDGIMPVYISLFVRQIFI